MSYTRAISLVTVCLEELKSILHFLLERQLKKGCKLYFTKLLAGWNGLVMCFLIRSEQCGHVDYRLIISKQCLYRMSLLFDVKYITVKDQNLGPVVL